MNTPDTLTLNRRGELGWSDFLIQTYWTMSGGLAVTAAVAWAMIQSDLAYVVASSRVIFYGLVIVELLLVWVLASNLKRFSPTASLSLFLVYAALNGVTLTPLFLIYQLGSVANVFAITTATFGLTALFAQVTRLDLTKLGGFFFMGLIGLIVARVANIWIGGSNFDFWISVASVGLFVGLTVYDIQKLRQLYIEGSSEGRASLHIYGALELYLDFVNLFVNLLRLLGRRK